MQRKELSAHLLRYANNLSLFAMITFFPQQIASKAFYFYLAALTTVSLVFFKYAMAPVFICLGIIWTATFFFAVPYCIKRWNGLSEKDFLKRIFWIAVLLRVIWVIFSYFFYQIRTGQPFAFGSADELGYHYDAEWLAGEKWSTINQYLFTGGRGISDSGYAFVLTLLYKIIGPNIFLDRIIKSCISAFTCILIYKLGKRNMNEHVGRMAAIFCVFMPNLIFYCGLHLKETLMIFLITAFLERADYLMRSKKYNVINILLPTLLAASLFCFRTVIGAVTLFSFLTALIVSTSRTINKGKRWLLIGWIGLAIIYFAGGSIANEIDSYWEGRGDNQATKRAQQTKRGNLWAQYATGTVMAPMMFVIPFPTMVDVDEQYTQQMLNGGNYVRNFLGIFVLIALYCAIFTKKNWRDLSLIGAFLVGYLGVIALSGFANSERFVLPALPILLLFAAYGVNLLNGKSYRFVKYWYWVVIVMAVAWAYFKLGSRGLF